MKIRMMLRSFNPAITSRRYCVRYMGFYDGRFESFWLLRNARAAYDSAVADQSCAFITLHDEWSGKDCGGLLLARFDRGDKPDPVIICLRETHK